MAMRKKVDEDDNVVISFNDALWADIASMTDWQIQDLKNQIQELQWLKQVPDMKELAEEIEKRLHERIEKLDAFGKDIRDKGYGKG